MDTRAVRESLNPIAEYNQQIASLNGNVMFNPEETVNGAVFNRSVLEAANQDFNQTQQEQAPTELSINYQLNQPSPTETKRLSQVQFPSRTNNVSSSQIKQIFSQANDVQSRQPSPRSSMTSKQASQISRIPSKQFNQTNGIQSNGIYSRQISQTTGAPPVQVSQVYGLPSKQSNQVNEISKNQFSHVSFPSKRISQTNRNPSEQISQLTRIPSEQISQPSRIQSEQITQPNRIPSEHINQFSRIPSKQISQLNGIPSKQIIQAPSAISKQMQRSSSRQNSQVSNGSRRQSNQLTNGRSSTQLPQSSSSSPKSISKIQQINRSDPKAFSSSRFSNNFSGRSSQNPMSMASILTEQFNKVMEALNNEDDQVGQTVSTINQTNNIPASFDQISSNQFMPSSQHFLGSQTNSQGLVNYLSDIEGLGTEYDEGYYTPNRSSVESDQDDLSQNYSLQNTSIGDEYDYFNQYEDYEQIGNDENMNYDQYKLFLDMQEFNSAIPDEWYVSYQPNNIQNDVLNENSMCICTNCKHQSTIWDYLTAVLIPRHEYSIALLCFGIILMIICVILQLWPLLKYWYPGRKKCTLWY